MKKGNARYKIQNCGCWVLYGSHPENDEFLRRYCEQHDPNLAATATVVEEIPPATEVVEPTAPAPDTPEPEAPTTEVEGAEANPLDGIE